MSTEDFGGIEGAIARIDARCRSNSRRIHELESSQQAVRELALSVRAMATEQSNIKEDLGEVKNDVKLLTQKAGRRWDALVEKAVWLAAGALISFALAQIGL